MKNNKESCELFNSCLSDWLNNSKETLLSAILVDSIPTLVLQESNESRFYQLVTYIKLIDLIETLGWLEHTCDWDLGLLITFKNGTTINTGHGYSDITIPSVIDLNKSSDFKTPDSFDNLIVQFQMESNRIESVLLSGIKSISLYR